MLKNFKLAVLVKVEGDFQLFSVPLTSTLQNDFAVSWEFMRSDFCEQKTEISFDAGYSPEKHERFVISSFDLPNWFVEVTSRNVSKKPSLGDAPEKISAIKAVVGFANDGHDEVILFQSFGPSHVIKPKSSILFKQKNFESNDEVGLSLSDKLTAVYNAKNKKVIFFHYGATNVYLPLAEFFEEASEDKIREILSHDKVVIKNPDALAKGASQWFRKRFSMLDASGVLDDYEPSDIKAKSNGYDIDVVVESGKLVFPENKTEAKQLLQFLNEEIYKGAITDTLYETNSKREVD